MSAERPKRRTIDAVKLEGETTLHDLQAKKMYVLNPTASLIWDLCDGDHTLGEITSEIQKRFNNQDEDIQRDVSRTIKRLTGQGLLR